MEKRLFLIFNHKFSHLQEQDARASLGVSEIIAMPQEFQSLWSNVPPELDSLGCYLEPVKRWLGASANQGDYVLIQGDFGACYSMVRFTLRRGMIPIYSTTAREATESHEPDGAVRLTHRFVHIRFRKYGE